MRKLVWIAALLLATACGDGESKVKSLPDSLAISRAELSFGAIFVGGHFVDRVQVQNIGIRSIDVVAEDLPPGFEVDPPSFRLEPQQLVTVEVAFRPREVGPSEGSISFRSRDPNSRGANLRVEGLGIAHAIRIPSNLDFGDVKVGEEASLPIEFVSETDAPLEVGIHHVSIGSFRVSRSRFDLGPGASETVVATFAPTARSPATMTLVIDVCTGCPTMEIRMEGNGLGPQLVASQSPIAFGDVAPGLTRVRPVTITNMGEVEVVFGDIDTEGIGFGVDPTGFAKLLGAGDASTLQLTFSPPGDGERTGTLFLDDTGGKRLLALPLMGATGGAFLEVTPEAVDFDYAVVGATIARAQVSLENVLAPEDVELLSVEIEGADASAFSLDLPAPTPIRLRPSASMQVTFAPSRAGDLSAELVLRTTHTEQPEIRVPLSGIGVAPVSCTLWSPFEDLRFGLVDRGDVNRREHRIYNVGTEPCPIWGFTTSGDDLSSFYFPTPPQDPVVLRPGAMVSIPIELEHNAPRDRLLQANLSFRHSALDSAPTEVPISAWLASSSGLVASPASPTVEATPSDRATISTVRIRSPQMQSHLVNLTVTEDSGFRLHPNQRPDLRLTDAEISVVFQPEERRLYAAEITVAGESLPEPLRIRVFGEGKSPCGDQRCDWPSVVCGGTPQATWWTRTDLTATPTPSNLPIQPGFTCAWTYQSGEGPATLQPDFQEPCRAALNTTASGWYATDVLVADSIGHAAYCRAHTQTTPPQGGLWIEAIPTSAAVRSPGTTILHAGTGGDPLLKPSWGDVATSCSMQFFRQTPAQCPWDEVGTQDDPFGTWAQFGGVVETSFMYVSTPSKAHGYHVGFYGQPFPTNGVGELRGRVFCDGLLVAEDTFPISATSEFQFLGTVTFPSGGGCQFEGDGTTWGRHLICQPGEPHCP